MYQVRAKFLNICEKMASFYFTQATLLESIRVPQILIYGNLRFLKLLGRAKIDKRFLVTSRTAIRNEVLNVDECKQHEMAVTERDYPSSSRGRIIEFNLKSGTWQWDFYHRESKRILESVTVPLAAERFSIALQAAPAENVFDLNSTLRQSQVDATGAVRPKRLRREARKCVHSTCVLWAVLMAAGQVTNADALLLDRCVRKAKTALQIDTVKLLNYLRLGRWVLQAGDSFSAHPAILDGFEKVINSNPRASEDVITALIIGLSGDGHISRASNILRQLEDRKYPLPIDIQNTIDDFRLESFLLAGEANAATYFDELVNHSKSMDAAFVLLRSLKMKERTGFRGFDEWVPPSFSETELRQFRESHKARSALQQFVKYILPQESPNPYGHEDLRSLFKMLGWTFTEELTVAIKEAIDRGNWGAKHLIKCLDDSVGDHWNEIIETALTALKNEMETGLSEEKRRAIDQCELDYAEAEWLSEPPDGYFVAIEALKIAVKRLRDIIGCSWILRHRAHTNLTPYWVDAIEESKLPIDDTEVQDLFKILGENDLIGIWRIIRKTGKIGIAFDRVLRDVFVQGGHLQYLFDVYVRNGSPSLCAELARHLALYSTPTRLTWAAEMKKIEFKEEEGWQELRRKFISMILSPQELLFLNSQDSLGTSVAEDSVEIPTKTLLEIAEYDNRFEIVAAKILNQRKELPYAIQRRLVISQIKMERLCGIELVDLKVKTLEGVLVGCLADDEFSCRILAMNRIAPDATTEEISSNYIKF